MFAFIFDILLNSFLCFCAMYFIFHFIIKTSVLPAFIYFSIFEVELYFYFTGGYL